jgi:hypothetical protein
MMPEDEEMRRQTLAALQHYGLSPGDALQYDDKPFMMPQEQPQDPSIQFQMDDMAHQPALKTAMMPKPDPGVLSGGGMTDSGGGFGSKRDNVSMSPDRIPSYSEWLKQKGQDVGFFDRPEMQQAMLRFGASMLSSDKPFFNAAGDALNAGLDSLDSQYKGDVASQRANTKDRLDEATIQDKLVRLKEAGWKQLGPYVWRNVRTGEAMTLSPAEAEMVGKLRKSFSIGKHQKGETYIGRDGRIFESTFDPNTGAYKSVDMHTGEEVDGIPEGAIPREQTGLQWQNKKDYDARAESIGKAERASDNIARLERVREQGTALAGPDWWTSTARTLASVTGFEIGDINPDDLSSVRREVAEMALQAAEKLRGQGQITEGERQLVKDTVANPEAMTPQALGDAINILIRSERRNQQMVDEFLDIPRGERPDFLEWRYGWRKKLEAEKGPNSESGSSLSKEDVDLINKYTP